LRFNKGVSMLKRALAAAVVMISLVGAVGVQPIPEPETVPHVGEMKVRKLEAMRYLHRSMKTSFPTMGQAVEEMMKAFNADTAAGKVPAGQYIYTYEGVGEGEQFTLKIGLAVKPGVTAPEGYLLTEEPEYLCATVIYTGPTAGIGNTWGELLNGVQAEGYVAEGSGRDYYLYVEKPESPNNVVMLAVRIKP